MKRFLAAMLAAEVLFGIAGCRNSQPKPPAAPVTRGQVPDYATVAAAYNKRVDPLVRLWARTVVRLKFVDADGKPQQEQVEGFCQFVTPTKALVTFHKVGQVLAMLGSDGERYWWIELGEKKRAFIGRHECATAERIASAGLRVHPLDLMELLGLTPLPAASEETKTAWSAEGKWIVVTLAGRIGQRRLMVHPDTHEPGRVEIVGEGGRVLAVSDLEGFVRVSLKGAGPDVPRPRVPTKVTVEADGGATRIIMDLSEPQDDPGRFKPFTFDFDKLKVIYDVTEVVDLDKPPPAR